MKQKRKKFLRCRYRNIKTTQERRKYYDTPDLVRTKRKPSNLPNAWDDISVKDWQLKSWKNYRKTQYKQNRGQKHEIVIYADERISTWDIEQYFEDNNISYQVNKIYKIGYGSRWGRLVKEVVVWWSDKDIGIEYLCKKYSY